MKDFRTCDHQRSYYHCASNICPDCGHRWGGPDESRLRREGMLPKLSLAPRQMLCGRDFLLAIARRTGTTETDEEILARFRDCLTADGYYHLGKP